jgi:hypothetical protein
MDEDEIGAQGVQAWSDVDALAPAHEVVNVQGDFGYLRALLSKRVRPCVDQGGPSLKVLGKVDIELTRRCQPAEVPGGQACSCKVALHGCGV